MIWLLARREITTRGRTKGFRITTVVLFVAVIGLAVAPSLIGGGDDQREATIGVVDASPSLIDALAAGDDDLDMTVEPLDASAVEAALETGRVDVVLTDSSVVWDGPPDPAVDDFVRFTVQERALIERAADLGLNEGDVGQLLTPVELDEVRLDGGGDTDGVRFAAGFVAGIATFMFLQLWGSFVMMGVIEEKSSRIVEILLAQVRPRTLLAGKVIGLGVLAVVQMVIVVAGVVLGLLLVDDVDIPAGVWASVPLLLATFLLGFGFYATAFAAVGSMVSRQEDAQGVALPIAAPLLVGYLIGSASLATPDNAAMTIGSFVPLTSPVLLPMRTALTDVPAWQIATSLGLLVVSAILMLRLAGWIYRFSLLRTGSRVRWSDLWRSRAEPSVADDSVPA